MMMDDGVSWYNGIDRHIVHDLCCILADWMRAWIRTAPDIWPRIGGSPVFRWILLILIVLPAAELWLLIRVGSWIGAWETIALVILTGVLGAYLARREFRRVWKEANTRLSNGQIPGLSVIDGLCVFAGGLLLLTPGLITDMAGFLLLIPFTRRIIRERAVRLLRKMTDSGTIRMFYRRF